MTGTTTTPEVQPVICNDDDPYEPCCGDCVYLDGRCRCRHGCTGGSLPAWWTDREPPF
jgi:hypothetical protein